MTLINKFPNDNKHNLGSLLGESLEKVIREQCTIINIRNANHKIFIVDSNR